MIELIDMSYKFLAQSLNQGRYEPEGIYLSLPLPGACYVAQAWGEQSAYYGAFSYNGVPLKGHNGIDFLVRALLPVTVVDDGRVMEIGLERGGYERYVKVEHVWGESFYAHLGQISVDAGQRINRGSTLSTTALLSTSDSAGAQSYLHFGIRIKPFNRFDGWGGFVDPIPFLDPTNLLFAHTEFVPQQNANFTPHPMMAERGTLRRP